MINYVEILYNDKEEAYFYYQKSWEQLFKKPIKLGLMHTRQILETIPTEETLYNFMLIVNYENTI